MTGVKQYSTTLHFDTSPMFFTSNALADIIFLLLPAKPREFCRYLSVAMSHFDLENHYIPAKHSSKVHI